ncbi:MAG: SusC/RagA family TonB-linked outer membrane protein [Mangrovibacterium sp.]
MRKGVFTKLAPSSGSLPFLTKISFTMVLVLFVCTSAMAASESEVGNKTVVEQQDGKTITVSGNVRSADGPLPGVTVLVTGTRTATLTDMDGNYTLSGVPADASITFSFVGLKTTTLSVNGKSKLDATLEPDSQQLEEIVHVGYGTQTKGTLTSAVATVSANEISELPVSNLSESLQGLVPGLNISNVSGRPGEAADVSIRQTFSLSKDGGTSVPLVIIDDVMQLDANTGQPTLEQFNMLDPSEIESVSVLKDASAAIYGARAAQGAIIVTTKRGKKGKTKITYSGQVTYNDAIRHSKTLSGAEYGQYWNTLLNVDGNADVNNLYSMNEIYDMSQTNYNWLDEAWSGSFTQRHSLGVSGGSDNATYYAGISMYDQGANLGSQDYKRWNFRTNVSVKVADGLSLEANIGANQGNMERSYTKSSSGISNGYARGSRADYAALLHMPSYIPWEVEHEGETYFFSPILGANQSTTASLVNSKSSMAGWNYFANEAAGSKSTEESMSYTANFALKYDVPFIKGLSLKGTFSVQQSYADGDQVALPVTLLYQENTNQANNHLYNPNGQFAVATNNGGDNLQVLYDSSYNRRNQYNFYVNYARSWGEHTISAMGSIERSEGFRSSKRMVYSNPDDPYLGGSSTAGDIQDASYIQKFQTASMSYLGRINYSYGSKYLLSFLIRSDASTKFAPENYWGTFPSVSAGWIISEEDWFANALPWVDNLKLRYSFGLTGKDNIRSWLWLQQYDYTSDGGMGFGSNGGDKVEGLRPGKTPNRDVKWDKTYKNNFGIDAAVLDNRLSVGFDYYYDMARDMLTVTSAQLGTPITTGGSFTEQNYSSINSWGYEMQIGWSDRINKDMRYNVSVNFGRGNNKVVKYYDTNYRYEADVATKQGESTLRPDYGYKVWTGTSGGDGIMRTQQDIDNYWDYLQSNSEASGSDGAYYFGTTDKSQMKLGSLAYQDRFGKPDDNGNMTKADGRIGEDGSQDYYELAKANARRGFVTNLGFSYKAVSLKAQISTSWGGATFIDRVVLPTNEFFWNPESFWADMYNPANPMAGFYPIASQTSNLQQSDFWTVNSFRCFVRNLSVAYNIPKATVKRWGLESASVSFTGYNLWDFYNPYPDKYRNMYDSSTAGYPTLRSWSIGLNVQF